MGSIATYDFGNHLCTPMMLLAKTLAHLLKYDSIHGIFNASISAKENQLIVNGKTTTVFNENHPSKINWSSNEVNVVVEATGKFKARPELEDHLKESVNKVILSCVVCA